MAGVPNWETLPAIARRQANSEISDSSIIQEDGSWKDMWPHPHCPDPKNFRYEYNENLEKPSYRNSERKRRYAPFEPPQLSFGKLFGNHPGIVILWLAISAVFAITNGYMTVLSGAFLAHKQFTKKFGTYIEATGECELEWYWTAAYVNGYTFMSHWASYIPKWMELAIPKAFPRFAEKYMPQVHRVTAWISLSFCAALMAVVCFAPHVPGLVAARMVCGLFWGVASANITSFLDDLLGHALGTEQDRRASKCWTQLLYFAGQTLVFAAQKQSDLRFDDEWSFRLPMLLSLAGPIILSLLLLPICFPEKIVKKVPVAYDEKMRILSRNPLNRELRPIACDATPPAFIKQPLGKWRIFWTNMMVTAGRTMCGGGLSITASYFYTKLKFPEYVTHITLLVDPAIAFVAGALTIFVINKVAKRRHLYTWGMLGLAVISATIGVLGRGDRLFPDVDPLRFSWAAAGACMLWTLVNQLTVSRVATDIRSVASYRAPVWWIDELAAWLEMFWGIGSNILGVFALDSTKWNLGSDVVFFTSGVAFVSFVLSAAFLRLPLTKEEYMIHARKERKKREAEGIQVDEEAAGGEADDSEESWWTWAFG